MHTGIVSRRGALLSGLAAAMAWHPRLASAQDMSEELQSGDPEEEREIVVADQDAIGDLFSIVAFNVKKDAKQVALRTLKVAQEFVGNNQQQNPEMVEEFFAIFAMAARNGAGKFWPFCAAGLSYCAARAYCDYEVPHVISYTSANRRQILREALSDLNKFYFRPNPLVRVIESDARKRNTWLDAQTDPAAVQPGYLVVFDWDGDRGADHIGLVEGRSGDSVHTVEFNTRLTAVGNPSRGGHVLKKTRSIGSVLGFVRTYV